MATYIQPENELAPATRQEMDAAILRHCADSDSEIEIDEPAKASRGDDGVWVQAWVFVPNSALGRMQGDE